MTVEDGHAFNDGIGEVHDDINRASVWNIHSIEPCRVGKRCAILSISEEMHLMDMKRMQLPALVDDVPMLVSAGANRGHRQCMWRIFLAVDVKAVLVFSEGDGE